MKARERCSERKKAFTSLSVVTFLTLPHPPYQLKKMKDGPREPFYLHNYPHNHTLYHPNNSNYTKRLKVSMKMLNTELISTILKNEKITDPRANPGIYTWIIKGTENCTFYATRVFTKQEIGTLHLDLDRQTAEMGDEREIISAGELEVYHHDEPPLITIAFNLQSGTFTKDIIGYHPIDISLIFPDLRSRVVDDIWQLFFGRIAPENSEVQKEMNTLFEKVQQDAWEIARAMLISIPEKINEFEAIQMVRNTLGIKKIEKDTMETRPNGVVFSNDNILELLRKQKPAEIMAIRLRIKNRFIIYKRDRMIEFVTRMFCSFFGSATCTDVQFLKSTKSNDNFIKTGDAGKEFEVTAGKSLIVDATILNRANNIERLSRYFKIKNNPLANVNSINRRRANTKKAKKSIASNGNGR